MRVGFVADLHLANHKRYGGQVLSGLNQRFRSALSVLGEAVAASGIDKLFVLGDLFDSTKPTPQELYALMELLRPYRRDWVHALVGNHDKASNDFNDHALAPLHHFCMVHEVPHRMSWDDHTHIIVVPYQSGAASEWLPEVVEEQMEELRGREGTRILAMHLGIADVTTSKHLVNAHDAVHLDQLRDLMLKWEIQYAYSGNWHTYRSWNLQGWDSDHRLHIVQAGALIPTGFDNPGTGYGKLIIHENDKPPEMRQLKGGPRFFTLPYEEADLLDDVVGLAEDGNFSAYVSVRARPAYLREARDRLGKLKAEGKIADFELHPDREVVRAHAHAAAKVTRNARTIDEAVAAYVYKAQLPEGAQRAQVLERVQEYLARK